MRKAPLQQRCHDQIKKSPAQAMVVYRARRAVARACLLERGAGAGARVGPLRVPTQCQLCLLFVRLPLVFELLHQAPAQSLEAFERRRDVELHHKL